MGYIRHHAILVTGWNEDAMKEAHRKATECFGNTHAKVSEIYPAFLNGYQSFAVFPDGSNGGWVESNDCDAARDRFVAWLDTEHVYDDECKPCRVAWVEVQYGDDCHETRVVRDSDARHRDRAEPRTSLTRQPRARGLR